MTFLHLSQSKKFYLKYVLLNNRYRLTIGHQTCVFEKESDPTALRTSAPGKLINYLQEDGSHVFMGQPYAEIEVM